LIQQKLVNKDITQHDVILHHDQADLLIELLRVAFSLKHILQLIDIDSEAWPNHWIGVALLPTCIH